MFYELLTLLAQCYYVCRSMNPERSDSFENDRRSCRKYFLTVFFLFVLVVFLRKQKEEEEEEMRKNTKTNLRQNEHNYRNFAFGYIRDISYLRYDSVIYISPNRKFVPVTHYIDDAIIHIEGYDNILESFENLALKITEENNNFLISASTNKKGDGTNQNDICLEPSSSEDSCARINTVLVDKLLFKVMNIRSCNSHVHSFCFFVFVQLKKSMCYNFMNLSHSCHSNYIFSPNILSLNEYCYIILASPTIAGIYEFIQNILLDEESFVRYLKEREKKKPTDDAKLTKEKQEESEITKDQKNKTNEEKEFDKENITDVEIISHFCGNVLNQIATIDTTNFRFLFVQYFTKLNEHNNKDTKEAGDNKENQHESVEANQKDESHNFSQYEKDSSAYKIHSYYLLSIIDIVSENREIVEYIDFRTDKFEYNIFAPIYIEYYERANLYYIIQYENDGCLKFIFISPDNLLVYYNLKIKELYSGWLLNPSFAHESKGLMLLGEYTPYEDELHVWNVSNFQHNRYFVSTIKTDSHI